MVLIKMTFLPKAHFLQKNGNIKIKEVFVLKQIFSETEYACVLKYQI